MVFNDISQFRLHFMVMLKGLLLELNVERIKMFYVFFAQS